MDRVLPQPTPETQHFWDGCKAGELRLHRCVECSDSYFPPGPFCPGCGSHVVARLSLNGLEDLGFCKPRKATAFIRERNTTAGGRLPLNTNGGGLLYLHSGKYGMSAIQESVRQMRGAAPAQIPGAKIAVSHGVGGMFGASGAIIFTNET